MSALWTVYALAVVTGLAGTRYLSKLTDRGWIRIIGGGASGSGTAALLEYGGAYSYFASAWYGGMGVSGYVFLASLGFLCLVWIWNLISTGDRTVR